MELFSTYILHNIWVKRNADIVKEGEVCVFTLCPWYRI